ncbi:MAG: ACT domain-containing protein, partial [Candidatus Hydrogenedentes bacterium]|nr:ACT domain-containing protein [Candidatus Hydrogenedentota bacterium]
NAQAERGFVAMRVVEPLDFKQVGVIATLTRALADAGISILAISTYETDVILFREKHKDAAREALSAVADTSRL